ncbi:Uncharacterised protein [Mycobacteroides abscessus]|nr:Uncharacterised protein [Mycobacteroides abscessus]
MGWASSNTTRTSPGSNWQRSCNAAISCSLCMCPSPKFQPMAVLQMRSPSVMTYSLSSWPAIARCARVNMARPCVFMARNA